MQPAARAHRNPVSLQYLKGQVKEKQKGIDDARRKWRKAPLEYDTQNLQGLIDQKKQIQQKILKIQEQSKTKLSFFAKPIFLETKKFADLAVGVAVPIITASAGSSANSQRATNIALCVIVVVYAGYSWLIGAAKEKEEELQKTVNQNTTDSMIVMLMEQLNDFRDKPTEANVKESDKPTEANVKEGDKPTVAKVKACIDTLHLLQQREADDLPDEEKLLPEMLLKLPKESAAKQAFETLHRFASIAPRDKFIDDSKTPPEAVNEESVAEEWATLNKELGFQVKALDYKGTVIRQPGRKPSVDDPLSPGHHRRYSSRLPPRTPLPTTWELPRVPKTLEEEPEQKKEQV